MGKKVVNKIHKSALPYKIESDDEDEDGYTRYDDLDWDLMCIAREPGTVEEQTEKLDTIVDKLLMTYYQKMIGLNKILSSQLNHKSPIRLPIEIDREFNCWFLTRKSKK